MSYKVIETIFVALQVSPIRIDGYIDELFQHSMHKGGEWQTDTYEEACEIVKSEQKKHAMRTYTIMWRTPEGEWRAPDVPSN